MPKMQKLAIYLNDSLVSTAKSANTRADDLIRLNEKLESFINTSDKQSVLKLDPFKIDNLKSELLGIAFARFSRLENPSTSLFDFLNKLKSTLEEKGQPSLFDEKGNSFKSKR